MKNYIDKELPAKNRLFGQYKYTAKKRNHSFKLSFNKFIELTLSNCYYCGVEPKQMVTKGKSTYIYNGIDRIDNTKGYTKNNCAPCCKICNTSKWKLNKIEFLEWRKKIAKHLITNVKNT